MKFSFVIALLLSVGTLTAADKRAWVFTDDTPKKATDSFVGSDGVTYEAGSDGIYRPARVQPERTPEVVAPKGNTFRSGDYWPTHNCPTCGRLHTSIVGWNRDGTHTHACWHDGTFWKH